MGSGQDLTGPIGVINPVAGRASNAGGGYGRLRGSGRSPADGSGEPRSTQSHFPYRDPITSFSKEEELQFFDDVLSDDDIDSFVSKILSIVTPVDPSNRADRASLVSNQPYGHTGLSEKRMHKAKDGPAPFSFEYLYPGGFSGPAMGGFSTDAAMTTKPGSMGMRSTPYGTQRAPIPIVDDDDEMTFSYFAIKNKGSGDLSDIENVKRQQRRVSKIIDEIDSDL